MVKPLQKVTIQMLLKKCWKHLPQPVRMIVLTGLCFLYAAKHSSMTEKNGAILVVGAFCSSSGLAQGARLYADKQVRDGRRVVCVDVTEAMMQRVDLPLPKGVLSLEQAFSIHESCTVVIHANPPQFQLVICKLGKKFLQNKCIIAYWAWEFETIPNIWIHALEYADTIEVPSTFVREALLYHTSKKISVVPHEIPNPLQRKLHYGKNGVLRCLYSFDFSSSFERKNPLAALKAFSLAFYPDEATLTFKVSGANFSDRQYQEFCTACQQVPGVKILTDTLSPAKLEELYLSHDIYLSLHRSEGYGLTIREAMLYGLHVIATGWSGNMDFMHGPLMHSVPYRLVPVRMQSGPYKGFNARWAEADVEVAVVILRGLYKNLCCKKSAAAF